MQLVGNRVLVTDEIRKYLQAVPVSSGCVLVVVGQPTKTLGWADQYLSQRENLVVLQVDKLGDEVRLAVLNPKLETLLAAVKDLCEHVGLKVHYEVSKSETHAFGGRKLLCAAINWIHVVMRSSVQRALDENGDGTGFSVTGETLLQMLDASSAAKSVLHHADEALVNALTSERNATEPLLVAYRAFDFQFLEFRLMLLAMAPELDVCYQRCIGYLQDDMSRRVGSLSLYCGLLGDAPIVRSEFARQGDKWRQFALDSQVTSADEPLNFDRYLAQWLLGESLALREEPKVRMALRSRPWPGARILCHTDERKEAIDLFSSIAPTQADDADDQQNPCGDYWTLLTGEDSARWRGLLELGAEHFNAELIRVEPIRFLNANATEIEEIANRLGRLASLTRDVLVVDLATLDETQVFDFAELFIPFLVDTRCRATIICRQATPLIKQLESVTFRALSLRPTSQANRMTAFEVAANMANARLSYGEAKDLATRYPLALDDLSYATRLAIGRESESNDAMARFTKACRELANQSLSHLADRLEPVFRLDDVILPADRKRQLSEIVEHVQFADQVLDGWKFREQLPFGRGVTALFFGQSGTGKTIAAMGIAHALGTQLLRVDLSRVVSKYIGDTEKNIDRIFNDAQESGSAILFDEAESLLGKRSEVKDAHDRYANIEVAYILQRMEAHEGLVILTTNLRQNIDAAFLRRLRFIVEFPRPDANAREQIWRFCLPTDSHALNDSDFRQLARKIDLTGGHIRQITLRAAFIAVAAGSRIGLAHIVDATRAEFAKLGLPPVEIDLGADRSAA